MMTTLFWASLASRQKLDVGEPPADRLKERIGTCPQKLILEIALDARLIDVEGKRKQRDEGELKDPDFMFDFHREGLGLNFW
jgi:hypothetical protein